MVTVVSYVNPIAVGSTRLAATSTETPPCTSTWTAAGLDTQRVMDIDTEAAGDPS